MKNMLLVLFLICPLTFAQVETITFIERIHEVGPGQQAGKITFRLTADEFPDASLLHPVIIKIALEEGAVLDETRVRFLVKSTFVPVYTTDIDGAMIAAPWHAVSIIRWREGESAIWLRINASTSEWVDLNGMLTAPSPQHPVLFDLGDSAEMSRLRNEERFEQGLANLPAYRQWGHDASTEIFLDLDAIVFSGLPLLTVTYDAFDGTGANPGLPVPENHIHPGTPLGTVFFGDDIIGAYFPL